MAALLAIAPAVSVDHPTKSDGTSISVDAARRSGAKASSF
jgi:hypothetical protein